MTATCMFVRQRYTGLQLVRTLVYPHGCSKDSGGSLALIEGAHLLREVDPWQEVRCPVLALRGGKHQPAHHTL